MRNPAAYRYFLFTEFMESAGRWLSWTVAAVYFVLEVDLNPLQLVLLGTIMEVFVFLFEVPTGVVADTYGRRRSLILGWLLMGSTLIVTGLVPSFPVMLAAAALWGVGATFTSGAYEAWITDEVGADHVGRAFLRGSQFAYLGALLGIGASVAIATFDLGLAVATGGAVVVALGLVSMVAMPETAFIRVPQEERQGRWKDLRSTGLGGARYVRAQPLLLLMMGITFFAGMASESFDRLWEAHFIREVGLPGFGSLDPVVWFGVFNTGGLVVSLVASSLLVRRFERVGHLALARSLLALTALLMGSLLVFALTGSFLLALAAFWVVKLARNVLNPLSMTWLNQNIADSRVRATVISINGQSDAIGEVAGGPAIGGIGTIFSIRAALVTGALVLSPALALYARALRHGGHEPELEELRAEIA